MIPVQPDTALGAVVMSLVLVRAFWLLVHQTGHVGSTD